VYASNGLGARLWKVMLPPPDLQGLLLASAILNFFLRLCFAHFLLRNKSWTTTDYRRCYIEAQ
jgi:hypothetical protein